MKRLPLRQGDVLLFPVDEFPADAALQPPTGNKVVLALGEVTGHHHRFEFMNTDHNVKMFHAGGNRYVHVESPNGLKHEEHSTVPADLAVGKWLLPVQVEFTPAELRRVQD